MYVLVAETFVCNQLIRTIMINYDIMYMVLHIQFVCNQLIRTIMINYDIMYMVLHIHVRTVLLVNMISLLITQLFVVDFSLFNKFYASLTTWVVVNHLLQWQIRNLEKGFPVT